MLTDEVCNGRPYISVAHLIIEGGDMESKQPNARQAALEMGLHLKSHCHCHCHVTVTGLTMNEHCR
jgi:hypothetical protein